MLKPEKLFLWPLSFSNCEGQCCCILPIGPDTPVRPRSANSWFSLFLFLVALGGAWRWFRAGGANLFLMALLILGVSCSGDRDSDDASSNGTPVTDDDDDGFVTCSYDTSDSFECPLETHCAIEPFTLHNIWPNWPMDLPYCICDCDGAAIRSSWHSNEDSCQCDGEPTCVDITLELDKEAWRLRNLPCSSDSDCMLLHKVLNVEQSGFVPFYYPINVENDLSELMSNWEELISVYPEGCRGVLAITSGGPGGEAPCTYCNQKTGICDTPMIRDIIYNPDDGTCTARPEE